MALTWTISATTRLSTVTAEGALTCNDFDEYLLALKNVGAMRFAKLFDASRVEMDIQAEDLLALGVRIRNHHRAGEKLGALAIILPMRSGELAERFGGILAAVDRPIKFFTSSGMALRWLKNQ